jgi:Tfp pilus assembly protein PilN
MRKHPRQAFGIFHDGLVVRMVHLVREGNEVYLQAVDHTDLDKYWYKILDDPTVSAVDAMSQESKGSSKSDIEIDEFDSDYVTNYQLQPSERMLGAFDLHRGVIALNVYDDNIIKDSSGAYEKKDIKRIIKTKVPLKEQKAGEYQSSVIEVGATKQLWLHHGSNRLLELLKDHSHNNHQKLYYQLADANDIALTDYFRNAYWGELDGRVMLVYLGQEYRKAFVFEEGSWQQTLKLQITQSIPDEETITSKLALAIDSAAISEPERIIICGDLASSELVEYMLSQFASVKVELFAFRNIIISSASDELHDNRSLSKYCLPIALAYKALHKDEEGFIPSNFLPSKIIEGQKEFKIAWHGLLILLLIFATAIIATNLFLKNNQALHLERMLKSELNLSLRQKQAEADRINRILSDMENQDKNLEALGSLLDGKNYWTHLLHRINTNFRANPSSWITNLKLEKKQIYIAGVTSRRANVIAFANEFSGSQIRKVSHGKIRDNDIWVFELLFDPPDVAWMEEIEQQMRAMLATRAQEDQQHGTDKRTSVVPSETPRKVVPAVTSQSPTVKVQQLHLGAIDYAISPGATAEMLAIDPDITAQYQLFVDTVNMGNVWEYRKQGMMFLSQHANHPLSPIVRWWMAYRMYLDKEYSHAEQALADNLNASSDLHMISLLLQARLYLAVGNRNYIDLYDSLERQAHATVLEKQIAKDIEAIAKGAGR